MKGTPAVYLGRIIDKENFRAFIYGANGQKKLVESWEAFEASMQSGLWFASIEDAEASKKLASDLESVQDEVKEIVKPKSKPAAKSSRVKEPPQKAQKVEEDAMGFEVTDENK